MHLVTGGAGFIGSHLVEGLLARGERVRVLDNLTTGKLDNLAAVRDRVDFALGDLRDEAVVRRATEGVAVVYHEAAISSVPRSVEDPRTTLDVNVTGTLNVLQAAREAGCRRVVLASSAAVYGDDPELPKREGMLPAPLSPYAVSKLTDEHLCAAFGRVHGLETVALRYFNVYGPRQDPSSAYSGVISRFVDALRSGQRPVVFGDGEQTRDFVNVADVVRANLLAAEAEGASGRVVNIASGRAVSLNALLASLGDLLGVDPDADRRPPRPGDIRHSLADVSVAREVLGWEPRVGLGDGLRGLLGHDAAAG